MPKIKVSQLAKSLNIESKELLNILKDLDVPAKSAASSIESEAAKLVRDLIKEEKAKKKETKPKAAPKSKAKKPTEKKKEKPAKKKEPEPTLQPQAKKEIVPPSPPAEKEKPAPEAEKPSVNKITLATPEITPKELAEKIGTKLGDVIKKLMARGVLATINQRLDIAVAAEVAKEFDWEIEYKEKIGPALPGVGKGKKLIPRCPVVTILGHVDHGKTKLLDAVRKTDVISTEAGGITQHIGAYQVKIKGRKITFLDTPGHEAFTALRARGAKVTDIAVLVVAADDGVKPQTIEAIDHARAAKVPIVVTINKIDKPEANPERVKQQLAELGLVSEDWGGDTVTVAISAKQATGIDSLLEMLLLVADLQELKADAQIPANGVIIESKLDRQRGPVATVLVRNGTLKIGDPFYVGPTSGKVRALLNDHGKKLTEAPPATPVEVLGLANVPPPGEVLQVVKNEKEAKEKAAKAKAKLDQEKAGKGKLVSLEDFSKHVKEAGIKNLNLIIKADVQGSLEALNQSLKNLSTEHVRINIIHGAVGAISRSDVMLAEASQAIVIGFGVSYESDIEVLAASEGVDVRLYKIIYKVTDDIKLAMEGLLEPEYEEVVVGHAEVRQLFKYSKVGIIAGSYVTDGKMFRGAGLRILREGNMIFEGKLSSLKRFKDDVKEVQNGYECGISISGFADFKAGDIAEAFETREKPRRKI